MTLTTDIVREEDIKIGNYINDNETNIVLY